MSKKETRRASRQAFPKAKTAGGTKAGARVKSSGATRSQSAARPGPKPPTIKRAAIQGAILAVLYFLAAEFVIERIWGPQGTTTLANVIFALGAFVLYTGIAYGADTFKYRRSLRKQKGSSK